MSQHPLIAVIERSTRLGERTKEDYTRYIQRFLSFAGGDSSTWTGATVEAWRDHLAAQALQPGTVNKHIYALRCASRRISDLGIGADFARAAETIAGIDEKKRTALTEEEVSALFATCAAGEPPDLRDRMIMTLALRTSSRVSNLVGLRWEDIEGRVAKMVIKGRKVHKPILDDACLSALEDWGRWLEWQGKKRKGHLLRRLRTNLDGDWTIGDPITTRQWVNAMLKKRAADAGITRSVHPHLFRHTFVTWTLEAGVPPHRVMKQTGHASMATLSKYVDDIHAESDPVGGYLPEIE